METRRELIEAVAARYRAAGRRKRKRSWTSSSGVTGFHRKHAIRVLETVAEAARPRSLGNDSGSTTKPYGKR